MKKILLALGLASVTAGIQAAPPAPTIEVTVTGQGSVTSNPAGLDCREGAGVCTSKFSRGDTVTLTATPEANANFVSWSGACEGTEQACTLNLKSGTKTVSALFETIEVSFPSPVQATGQTSCYHADGYEIACEGTGQDGEISAGVQHPDPRFTDNGDGTVTDNVTGLMWLKNMSCITSNYPELATGPVPGSVTWQFALDFVNGMNNGTYYCDTERGGWRLPNIRELQSLIDYGVVPRPALTEGHPFENVQDNYWSSTSKWEGQAYYAMYVSFETLTQSMVNKNTSFLSVTLVRDNH